MVVSILALAGWAVGWWYVFHRTKHKIWFFLSMIILVLSTWFILQLGFVQNFIVKEVSGTLSAKLHAEVSLHRIHYRFFDKMEMEKLLVRDQKKDTLLYAGSAMVNITDWFFIKNKATVKYVGLEDAQVNMHRKDSVWNYQFIIDYFAGPKKDSSKTNAKIEFDVKTIELKNISFNQVDEWVGHNMRLGVKELNVDANLVDGSTKRIELNSIFMKRPVFSMEDYTGFRPDSLIVKKVKKKNSADSLQWNNSGWVFNVKNLELKNGLFRNENETDRAPYSDRFDGAHLAFDSITGTFKNLLFRKDTLTADVDIASKERSGFQIKKLKAKFKFTPEIMEFSKLNLMTNRSHLGDYYAMKFTSFSNDMNNFLHNVTLQANFVESELNTDDLAFFAPELKDWKRTYSLKGSTKGTIDNLSARNMLISNSNTILDGDISMKGLPDINKTFIDFRANDLQTNYTDLAAIIPSLKTIDQPQLSKLGNIRYQGNFTGFINDFVAYGTIQTRLGMVTGDINLKLPDNKPAIYLGKLSTNNFKLGEFLDNSSIGTITFNGKVNGSGFSQDNITANFDGNIRSLGYGGYDYQNLVVKGEFKNRLFNGELSIDDPNLKLEYLKGTIDLSGEKPDFAFDALLNKASLKEMKLTLDDFVLSGHFNLNFTGSNIDNFLGMARISSASLLHNGKPLSFDSLSLESSFAEGTKNLVIHSNELDASLKGNYHILELPEAFKAFLSRYYPSYIPQPAHAISDQDFSFTIETKEVEPFIQLIDKRMSGFNNSIISGNLNLKQNSLNVNAEIPLFVYDGKTFNDIRLSSKGNRDTLQAKVDVGEIVINDSLRLPTTNLNFKSYNDISDVNIETRASKTFGDASVNAQLKTFKDGVNIHFFPSSFIINDKKWQLEKDGELTLSKSQVSANEVKFVQGNQQIVISTEPSELYNSHDVVVKLQDVNIEDFVPFAFKQPKLEGAITGSVRVMDPFGKPYIEYDTKINQFRLDSDSIGVVNAKGTYSAASGIASFKVGAENQDNKFKIEGIFSSLDSTANQTDIAIVSESLNLSILNNYLNTVFTDIKGIANTSDLKIRGNTKHLTLTGTANIKEGSMLVNYTQCRYSFQNETVIFNPDEIDFGNITLKDTLNNTGTLSGKMYHRFFQDFQFDNVAIQTDKMLLLNTTKKDNSLFYGKVIGNAKVTLNGPITNMVMDISGEPSRTDTSHIYLVSGNSLESGSVDYIDFIQFGSQMERDYRGSVSSNMLVNLALVANPSCKIDVILDETTGDVIKGEGNGLLKITVGTVEPLSISGTYNITKGEYTFNFQTFLKKYFTVNSGTITWNGDPLNAQINIEAEYLASNVDFKNLSSADLRQKGDVIIIARLTETLLKPKIDFEFVLPESNPLSRDIIVTKRIQQFKEDNNELNKQVTSLLLFNTFISTQSFLSASSGYSVLSSTIGGVVSNALSGFFNKILQRYVKNTTLFFDLNTSVGPDLQNNVAKLQAAAKSGLVFTLLNGRLIISAGVNLDYNNPYIVNTGRNVNLFVTPDITAEWLLTKDGRIRLVGFNRTNYDLIGQRIRTGVSLSYRKDFDHLNQLFGKDEEKKRIKALEQVKPTK